MLLRLLCAVVAQDFHKRALWAATEPTSWVRLRSHGVGDDEVAVALAAGLRSDALQ